MGTNGSAEEVIAALLQQARTIHGHDQEALDQITQLAGKTLGSTVCALMRVDLARRSMTLTSCWPHNHRFATKMWAREIRLAQTLGPGAVSIDAADKGEWLERRHLGEADHDVVSRSAAVEYGFGALLGCPVMISGAVVAYLNHFVAADREFEALEKLQLEILSQQAAVAMEASTCKGDIERYKQLSSILQKIDDSRSIDEVLEVVLDGALALVRQERGWISRLNPNDSRMQIEPAAGHPQRVELAYGEGISGLALRECEPQRADDVHDPRWEGIYKEFWADTQSELAVPIVVRSARVLNEVNVAEAPKRLGVINLESPNRFAFSRTDEELLGSLASHAAAVIDRMDLDRKLAGLTRVQQQIVAKEDWDETVYLVTDAIASVLHYQYVNISVVHRENNSIETEHVIGLPKGDAKEFKALARHDLDKNDIQASVVRSQEIQVPAADDPRFDSEIYHRFGHDLLLRVFMPMMASTGHVIGTVDAGYLRMDWQHIYEEDVRILKQFVDYAAEALERRRRGLLDEITHELRSPAVGIRNNLSYLDRHWMSLDPDFISRKLGDMMVDTEVLLYQVTELEYFLGRPPQRGPQRTQQRAKVERTLVFRDVIIAALQQLKSNMRDRNFDPRKVEYDPSDVWRMGFFYVDKPQLKQVVYNLLLNSIKYAENDPAAFRIQISIRPLPDAICVRFRDWGIGIKSEYTGLVFQAGFRTPEAEAMSVAGSGLGLVIARRIMRDLGGELSLTNNRKPTEFQMSLPRKLQEAPQ